MSKADWQQIHLRMIRLGRVNRLGHVTRPPAPKGGTR